MSLETGSGKIVVNKRLNLLADFPRLSLRSTLIILYLSFLSDYGGALKADK